MDGLNHSVISGECPGCVEYKAQVARLGGEKAAVRDELGKMQAWAEDGPQKVWNHIVAEGCKHMLAALSDTGEGTEVREQDLMLESLAGRWLLERFGQPHDSYPGAGFELLAALDALGG